MVERVLNFIDKICLAGSTISIVAVMLFTSFEVLARKFFALSIPGLYELTSDYAMVALVFLSLSYVYIRGGHIRVTLFIRFLPKPILRMLNKILDLASFVLFVLIAIKGWENFITAIRTNEVSTSLIGYPMAPCYLMVPIGSGMLAIRILQNIIFPESIQKHQESQH